MYNYGYDAPCAAPPLSGFFGLGAALTPAQRRAANLAKQQAAKQARQQKQVAAKTARAAKRAAKVAGKTVQTSNPQAAAKIHAAVVAAQNQIKNVTALAGRARQTKQKVDIQKALVAANSAGNTIKSLLAPVAPPAAAARLRGLGYMGTCIDDGSGAGTLIDDQTGMPCDANGFPVDPNAGGGAYPQPYPQPYPQVPQYPGITPGLNTGLVPGFGTPVFGSGGYVPRGCNTGSNLPRCLIYQMAMDEQQQFQFVFSILQQMYAQLLSIVQQLLAQLQSAQQSPYAYGQQSAPYNPYGPSPYDPYSQYGGAGYGYGSQYPGPGGYPGSPYYAGGGDSSVIPPGYGDGGDMSSGVPGDVSQVFPGPSGGGGGAGYPIQSYGGPPPGLISSDSLPDGADQQGGGYGDDAAGLIPSSGSGPNLPAAVSAQTSQSTAVPTTAQPQIIVLQQGPGQSAYADAQLPAGNKQNQPTLDPPEHDEEGLTGY